MPYRFNQSAHPFRSSEFSSSASHAGKEDNLKPVILSPGEHVYVAIRLAPLLTVSQTLTVLRSVAAPVRAASPEVVQRTHSGAFGFCPGVAGTHGRFPQLRYASGS